MLVMATPNVGRYFGPGGVLQGSGNESLSTDRIYYRPFFVTREVRFDLLAFKPDETAQAGTTARCGIYTSLPTGLPDRLIAETALMPWTANATVSAALSMSESLFPGVLYYAAIIVKLIDGTRDFWRDQAGELGALHLGSVSAKDSVDGLVPASVFMSHSEPSWTVMPNPANTDSLTFSTQASPSFGAVRVVAKVATGFGGEGPGHGAFNFPWDAANKRWRLASRLVVGNSPSSDVLADGTVYYAPFFISVASRIANVALHVTTSNPVTAMGIGVYDSDPTTGQPNVLLGETDPASPIDSTSTGTKEAALLAPVVLTAKTGYWMAVAVSGATVSIRTISWAQSGAIAGHLGWSTLSAASFNARPTRSSWSVASFIAANGFPDPAGAFTYGGEFDNLRFIAYELTQ